MTWRAAYMLFVILAVTCVKWLPYVTDRLWTFRYRGDPITVVVVGEVLRGRIYSRRDSEMMWRPERDDRFLIALTRTGSADLLFGRARVQLADEGITWARGWDSDGAKALHVGEALA